MSSGKLSEQLAASPAICCCFSSREEQVNAMAGSQSPLPQYAYSYPSFSPSCAYPSVPRRLLCGAEIIELNSGSCWERYHSLSSLSGLLATKHQQRPSPSRVHTCWDRGGRLFPSPPRSLRGSTGIFPLCVEGLFVFISLASASLCQPT